MTELVVPWNACWSGEGRYEIRPCRYAKGALALWQPHLPGTGHPIFANPHSVRQRRSIACMVCTVCGVPTPPNDRWWFGLGEYDGDYYMTTEAPVHRVCADLALQKCPHLRKNNCARDLAPFPGNATVVAAIIGGPAFEHDYGIRTSGRVVIGHLKLAWPKDMVRVVRRDPLAT